MELSEIDLCVNIDKCIFHVPEVEFVGFQIGTQGVQMSQKKVEDILNWPAPRSVKEVQNSLGLLTFIAYLSKASANSHAPYKLSRTMASCGIGYKNVKKPLRS